ncbi:DUF2911 domain-containing protein [Reichenbachiella carrageenanivorans]|uniref:DUF2911 domain-containing protein n=1 Tax=Reichenbachiella carrageenanivorans TaxID=2979869 RepID=A0ABY6D094_9BACT|nr:DUF2911 domain-containing protein [Reichenbachiella carrageenanivorans]UXX79592.1 DUF2911 domain-containing protein [Reichenbachiella carrageenanivorans]
MIKKILWVVGAGMILFALTVIYQIATTRQHSPPATAILSTTHFQVTVDYCRPFKKGRKIFGELLPYDTYWRTGANEPTVITFSDDVYFGTSEVPAGKYRLYTIPGESEWQVVLNAETEQWGYWEPDYNLDVAKVTVPVQQSDSCVQQFLIRLTDQPYGANLALIWDFTKVIVPIKKGV